MISASKWALLPALILAAAAAAAVAPGGAQGAPAAATAVPARIELTHRFDMRQKPYVGVLYTVSIGPVDGGWRPRSWSRFSTDASYDGSVLAGSTELVVLKGPPGLYVVRAGAKPCAGPTDSCDVLGPAQDRCQRTFRIRAGTAYRVVVFAKSGVPCRVSVVLG